MWQQLRLEDRSKFPLEDGETYSVRMCIGVGKDNEDAYEEFECVWKCHRGVFIEEESYEVYDWADMDDVWVDDPEIPSVIPVWYKALYVVFLITFALVGSISNNERMVAAAIILAITLIMVDKVLSIFVFRSKKKE